MDPKSCDPLLPMPQLSLKGAAGFVCSRKLLRTTRGAEPWPVAKSQQYPKCSVTPPTVRREDVDGPFGSNSLHAFVVHNFFSVGECEYLIAQTEPAMRGLGVLFPAVYREGERALLRAPLLADEIFRRLMPLIVRNDVVGVQPMCFGHSGVWYPHGCNEAIKINKYNRGGFFFEHRDGPWIPCEDMASIYTVLVYLNEDFQGGETTFVELPVGTHDRRRTVIQMNPRVGLAAVFSHDAWHSAVPVSVGTKYVLRTELIFSRPRGVFVDRYLFTTDDAYVSAKKLYQLSNKSLRDADLVGFVDKYQQVVAMQRAAMLSDLIPLETIMAHSLQGRIGLVTDTFSVVLSFLPDRDLFYLFRLNHATYHLMNYCDIWQHKVEQLTRGQSEQSPPALDWLSIYRQHVTKALFIPAILFPLSEVPSVMAVHPTTPPSQIGGENLPMRKCNDSDDEGQLYVGFLLACSYEIGSIDPFHMNIPEADRYTFEFVPASSTTKGLVVQHQDALWSVHWPLLGRAVSRVVDCAQTPLIVVSHPCWNDEAKRNVFRDVFYASSVPAIAVLGFGECAAAAVPCANCVVMHLHGATLALARITESAETETVVVDCGVGTTSVERAVAFASSGGPVPVIVVSPTPQGRSAPAVAAFVELLETSGINPELIVRDQSLDVHNVVQFTKSFIAKGAALLARQPTFRASRYVFRNSTGY